MWYKALQFGYFEWFTQKKEILTTGEIEFCTDVTITIVQ